MRNEIFPSVPALRAARAYVMHSVVSRCSIVNETADCRHFGHTLSRNRELPLLRSFYAVESSPQFSARAENAAQDKAAQGNAAPGD